MSRHNAGVRTMRMRATRQGGFSLIELMVAMTVTLIVSGAIFGLLTAGQNAFRREPELADRQQNIRVAMDMITRDIVGVGSGMSADIQAFTITDPGPTSLNNPPPAMGSVPSVLIPGERADFLQMVANDGSCPTLHVCKTPGVNIDTNETLAGAACFGGASMLAYVWGSSGSAQGAGPPGLLQLFPRGGGGGCGTGHLNAPPGQNPALNPPGGACPGGSPSTFCQFVSVIQVVRYELGPDPDDANTPALYRSASGRMTNGGLGPCCVVGPPNGPNQPWQLVARGIEDMQIRYLTGAGWADAPAVVAGANPATWVREVQVTLSAKSMAQNLTGQTTNAVGGNAVRGQLTSVVSPRAALLNLDQAGQYK
jgi:prepilin-type N-terminal cleavage/methylation domain-containing protein